MKWTAENIPSQEKKVAIVTGANNGLGYYTSRALAMKGARVVMACRNAEKGEAALKKIRAECPGADLELASLDLAELDSVQSFSDHYITNNAHLHLLVNNAGLMAIPLRRTSRGFEMQFGVNHLGHFALTCYLWPVLKDTEGSRIVNVSSLSHRVGRIRFEDIHWEKEYRKWGAYAMSKLANLLFTRELANRLDQKGLPVTATSAHPGYTNTDLQIKGPLMNGSALMAYSFSLANRLVAQPAKMGALPVLYAATATGVQQGSFFGPDGCLRLRGYPVPAKPHPVRVNDEDAGRLWQLSEKLTGLEFRI